MEEKIPENQANQVDLGQTPVTVEKNKVSPVTIVILLIVILLVGVGGVYAGMQISKKQTPVPLVSQSTIIPTSFVQPTTILTSIPTQVVQPTIIPTSDATANWKVYTNKDFSFAIKYPPHWGMSETGYHGPNEGSMLVWGEPAKLEGLAVFSLYLFINENPERLSSEEYVSRIVGQVGKGESPEKISYKEKHESVIGGIKVVELYGVFAYDQSEERFYLPVGNKMLVFTFPIPEENPNIFKPIENNILAHKVLSSFKFTE